jgi:hypothetical protein
VELWRWEKHPLFRLFLPEIEFPQSSFRIEDFIPKSMKSGEIVRKVYNFKNVLIP